MFLRFYVLNFYVHWTVIVRFTDFVWNLQSHGRMVWWSQEPWLSLWNFSWGRWALHSDYLGTDHQSWLCLPEMSKFGGFAHMWVRSRVGIRPFEAEFYLPYLQDMSGDRVTKRVVKGFGFKSDTFVMMFLLFCFRFLKLCFRSWLSEIFIFFV